MESNVHKKITLGNIVKDEPGPGPGSMAQWMCESFRLRVRGSDPWLIRFKNDCLNEV